MSEIKVNSIKGVAATTAALTINNTDGTCTANITNNLSNRNLIINGGMKVAQRGTVTQLLYNYAGPDRFYLSGDGGQRSTISSDSITVDSKGQSHAYKLDVATANASPSAGHYQMIQYRFEGRDLQHLEKGTSNAQPITLSFWVKSPKAGTHIVGLNDVTNSYRHINKSYTVTNANQWQKVTITFEGDTTGVLANSNALAFQINWWLMAGSTFSSGTLQTSWGTLTNANRAVGQVNVVDSTSNDFYLTGVQLEVGSVATDFEHRSFGQELALCYRYYYRESIENTEFFNGLGKVDSDGNSIDLNLKFPVTMRTTPTAVEQAGSGTNYLIRGSSTLQCTGVPTYGDATQQSATIRFTRSSHGISTNNVANCGAWGASFLGFSAEL